MNRLAIISNPKSHRNLRGSALKPDLPKCPFFIGLAEPETQAELLAALTRFKQQGAEILAVNGGDGTLRDWPAAAARLPAGASATVSTSVFQAPQSAHWPAHLLAAAPQLWQTYRVRSLAM